MINIELTGTNTEYVLKPVTEKLAPGSSRQGTLVSGNVKYVHENINSSHRQKYNNELYKELFDVLEEHCDT